jgi:hypothetical protein
MAGNKGGVRFSEEQLGEILARRGACGIIIPKESKHHAKITEADGIKFGSKREAKTFRDLQARQHIGEIDFFLLQVPFLLPGKTDTGRRFKHYLDFITFKAVGAGTYRIEYIEVKGRDLALGKLKRRQVEELYNIQIQVV